MSNAERVLERLHKIAELRTAAKTKRSDKFEERDGLDDKIDELIRAQLEESDECRSLKAKHYEVCRELDRLKTAIKWHADQMESIINRSAKGDYDYLEDPVDVPDSLFNQHKEKPAAPKDERPVGEVPDASKGEGVDEHLNASPSELIAFGISDAIAKDCITGGYDTIGKLAVLVDGGGDLSSIDGVSEVAAKSLAKALGNYRTTHRKAMLNKERGE